MKKTLSGLLALSLLSGCASTRITDLNTGVWKPVTLKAAEVLPSQEELSGAPRKVVVLPAKTDQSRLAKKAKVGNTIASALEKYLSKTGVELVDRSIAGKLKNEIALAEMKGSASSYEGPDVANYVVTGSVGAANFNRDFTEGRTFIDNKGNMISIPPECEFKAEVKANIKFYEVPSLRLAKTVDIGGTKSSSRETRNSSCPLSRSEQASLVREAATNAVAEARTELQNFFAPRGYVLERRTNDDGDNIFKISLGTQQGAAHEQACVVRHVQQSRNPLTGEMNREEVTITDDCVISDQVNAKTAWVIVGDAERANRIKLGDEVNVKFKMGFGEQFMNALNH